MGWLRDWYYEEVDPLVMLGLITGWVVIFALVVAFAFVRKGRPRLGIFAGLAVIVLAWALSEILVIGGCMSCPQDDPLCCEWTGIGVVVFVATGIVAALWYLSLALGGIAIRRATIARANSDLRESRPRTRRLWLTLLGVPLICALTASLVLTLIDEGVARGYFVRWRPVAITRAQAARNTLETGDEINAQTTSGPCALAFHVKKPPGRVIEKADVIYCDASVKLQTSYARLEDGSFWEWEHSIDSDVYFLLSRRRSTSFGALSGFALGSAFVGIAFVFMVIKAHPAASDAASRI